MENGAESHSGRGFEKSVVAILLLLGFLITLALTIGEGLIHRNPKPLPETTTPVSVLPDPMEPPALAALEKFFEAPDTLAKSKLVRDTERVRPLMEDYHDRRNHPYPTLGRVSPGHAAEFQNVPCVLFEVEPFSGPRYPVAVVWDGTHFAVDWESLTAYGTMDWIEFTERRPTAPQTLRVFVSIPPADQKIPGLPDGAARFQVEHRDALDPLMATASSEVAESLTPITQGRRCPVTVEIAWKPLGPGGAPVPCITRLISKSWSY